jgi:hypothetical protein
VKDRTVAPSLLVGLVTVVDVTLWTPSAGAQAPVAGDRMLSGVDVTRGY